MEPDTAAYSEGCEAARTDLAEGRVIYRWTGHAGPWGHEFVALVRERFAMLVEGFGICFTTPRESSFNDGYNSVVLAETGRRFGNVAFDTVIAEAKARADLRHAELRRDWLEKNGHAEIGCEY